MGSEMCIRDRYAPLVYRQDGSFSSCSRGFDSLTGYWKFGTEVLQAASLVLTQVGEGSNPSGPTFFVAESGVHDVVVASLLAK